MDKASLGGSKDQEDKKCVVCTYHHGTYMCVFIRCLWGIYVQFPVLLCVYATLVTTTFFVPLSLAHLVFFSIHPSFNYIYMGHTESIYNAQNLVLILLFHYFVKWASPGIF